MMGIMGTADEVHSAFLHHSDIPRNGRMRHGIRPARLILMYIRAVNIIMLPI